MANATVIVAGNVVSRKELKELGTKGEDDENYVLNFRVASTDSRFDRKQNKWVDDPSNFIGVTVWGKKARNVDASIQVGNPVLVHGALKMREGWTNKDGEEMPPSQNIEAYHVGIDVCAASGESHRKPKGGASNSNDSSGRSTSSSNSSTKSDSSKSSKPSKNDADDFDLDLDLDGLDDEPGF